MRIDVKKFLFIGPETQKASFFQQAQDLGIIEFIDSSKKGSFELPEQVQKIQSALKILRGLTPVELEEHGNLMRASSIADMIITFHEDLEELREERRITEQEMHRVIAFGDFSVKDIEYIEQEAGKKIQFFFSKKARLIEAPKLDEVIHVGSDHDLDYFFAINSETKQYDGMVEMFIDKPYGELIEHKKTLIDQIHERELELKQMGTYKLLLKEAMIQVLNIHNLDMSMGFVDHVINETLFSVQAWIAESNIEKVQALMAEFSIYMQEIAVEKVDFEPTYLENTGLARVGEDLVHIYDTPSTEDKDPSKWVLWFFALFFSIIVGDGGYGVIFLVLAIFTRVKFPKLPDHGKRFVKLLTILALSTIVWGVLTSSFFGIEFSLKEKVKQYSPLTWLVEKKASYHIAKQDDVYDAWTKKFPALSNIREPYQFLTSAVITKDGKEQFIIFEKFADNILLELSLFIGIVHITIGFLRNLRRDWAGIGWVLFLIGGYLFFPSMLHATSFFHWLVGVDKSTCALVGAKLVYIGIIFAVVIAFIQKRLQGLGEVMRIIEVFSDVLSYLRLYALALAGSIMASTFNLLGAKAGFFVGILIIIIGHGVNIALSIMGGVIHGLRLNFLEWYHYCFDGGGRMLKPLTLLKLRK